MPALAIAPSPVARLLLELEERGASGGLDVGGRRLVLAKGAIVEVRPAPEDQSLGEFLVAAGRLSTEDLADAKTQMTATRASLETVIRQRDLLPIDVLLETRRALWLDRFVRGLATDEGSSKQPGLLTPEPHASPGPAISTLPFLLDALTRRAGFGDAELVGRNASAWFDWLPGPLAKRATEWADFGEVRDLMPASALFARHPAAPSRIAALVRAGLARLSEARPSIPPAPPRQPVIAAPAPVAPPNQASGSIAPPREILITKRESARARGAERPIGIDPIRGWFPGFAGPLQDPLDPIERRITGLEQAGARAIERAQAWLELARAFRAEHDSIEEAARAAREAAAADPDEVVALETAAELCSASGQPEIAYAYAQAAASKHQDAAARARSLVRAADCATRAGKASSALRALRLAHAAAPDEPIHGERYARKLAERGDPTFAVKAARQAAERYRALRPEAARSVLSWAAEIAPDHADVATDYASILAADGFGEAAVAVLVRAARRTEDAQVARRLFTNGAMRAEMVARPDLAADVLLEAVDRDPSDLSVLRDPLLANLSAAGNVVELAVIATDLADRAVGLERSIWLRRAAEARLELPGSPFDALELCTQALIAEPRALEIREMIEQFTENESDPRLFTDALERALRVDGRERLVMIELTHQLIVRTSSGGRSAPALERWAWGVLSSVSGPSPTAEQHRALEGRLSQYEAELRELEQAVRDALPEDRVAAGLRLADRMRDDPARRGRARKLLEKILELEPNQTETRYRLQRLLRLEGDLRALCAFESQRVTGARTSFERISAELSWIRAEREMGNIEGATQVCLGLLGHAPKNREALAWLLRLAQAGGNEALLRDARARRVESALDPRERARALTALANSCRKAKDENDALGRAEAALMADPRAAEAAMIMVELASALDPAHAVANLRAARLVLSDTPDLLSKLSRACFGTRDATGQLEALEAYARLSPFDPVPALALVALRSTGSDANTILSALDHALTADRYSEPTVETALTALERLFQLGHGQRAVEAVLRASDALGERVDLLVEWALPLAEEGSNPRLVVAILERLVARATGSEKRGRLRRLARFHRDNKTFHAEARTYLRLLALDPADSETLEQLAFVYAATREVERLMAVLTLRLDLAESIEDRRARLLELALASLEVAQDPTSAEDLLSAALASEPGEEGNVDPPLDVLRRGIGLVLGSEHPQLAFDLLLELSAGASPERSAQMLEEAISTAETHLHDPDLALRAAKIGLESHPLLASFLLHFERLALELGDVATGREVYRHLAESAMGSHGRRAVLYRGARWLERAGAMQDALTMAEEAFALSPNEGAVFTCLERLARTLGQHVTVVRALGLLADEAVLPRQRSQLLLRAATLCEDELRDPERALSLYQSAFRALPDEDVEHRALSCARRLADADESAAREAFASWRHMLEDQAKEAWALKPRVRALLSIARLEQEMFTNLAAANARVDEARKLVEQEEDMGADERSEMLADVAEALAKLPGRKDAALATAKAARALAPSRRVADLEQRLTAEAPIKEPPLPTATQTTARFGVVAPSMSEAPYDPSVRSTRSTAKMQYLSGDPHVARPRTYTDPGLAPVLVPPPAAPAQAIASSQASAGSALQAGVPNGAAVRAAQAVAVTVHREPVALRDVAPAGVPVKAAAVASPAAEVPEAVPAPSAPAVIEAAVESHAGQQMDPEALERLLVQGGNDPSWAASLCDSALLRARQQPLSVSTLRGLQLLASRAGRSGLSQVTEEVLSYLQGSVERSPPVLDPNDPVVRLSLLEARDDGPLAPAFTIMAHVFQGAGPLFRRPLSAFNVSANDFVAARDDGSYGTVLRDVFHLLGVQHEAYVRHGSDNLLSLISAQTPAIVIGAATPTVPIELRFRVGRLLEYARPGSLLLATLPGPAAETLLAAVRAAFGPTDSASAPVAREAASMAAELWRTMPSGSQRQVSNLFRVVSTPPSYAELMASIERRAVRVGLVAAGAVDAALSQLKLDQRTSEPSVPTDEAGFDLACSQDASLQALLQFALSDSYLALRDAPPA